MTTEEAKTLFKVVGIMLVIGIIAGVSRAGR